MKPFGGKTHALGDAALVVPFTCAPTVRRRKLQAAKGRSSVLVKLLGYVSNK